MLVVRPALGQSELQADVERHGMSGFGDLKYPADFKHLAYVNPNAPKGGQFSQLGSVRWYNQNFNTFNSLNSYIFKGDAALGMELTFATLMARAYDEPDAMYGLRSEEHTSELQSLRHLVCRLLLEKKKYKQQQH